MEQVPPMRTAIRQSDRQPIFFVPSVILILISLLAGVYVLRTLLAPDYDNFTLVMFGILPGRYMPEVISTFPGGVWSAIPPFITYAFLHADYAHLAINSAWLLAFGTAVVRKIGTARFLSLYLICAIGAALVHVAVDIGSLTPMIGASGAISGMMGAAFRISLEDIMEGRKQDVGPEGRRSIRLLPLYDRNFLTMSGVWLLVNVIFGLTGIRVAEHVLMIAWDAHIGGFVTGALLIGVFVKYKKVSGVTPA
jgi:membrane associated rhomboid family serine protease